jgi:K+-transporting ATPase ATPase C chain
MRTLLTSLRQHIAALRMLIIFTVIVGIAYPLAITVIAQIPGLQSRADGSQIKVDGKVVGSKLIGQSFTDKNGDPLVQYFQTRPSTGDYDPTMTGASNLGPESIVDQPDKPSLLTQVCTRSLAIGKLDGVDGSRPFCTPDGVGAVLAVFWSGPGYDGHVTRVVSVNQTKGTPFLATYRGVEVELAKPGDDYSKGQIVPIRGNAPANPAVPSDAVTASGSGVDPQISPAYAKIQEARVARARGITAAQVAALVSKYETGRDLGFMGEPRVNVLQLNIALDKTYPYRG